MAKYNMEKNGAIFRNNIMPGDTPVIVLHEPDWRELVAAVSACGGKGSGPVDRIHAIIEKVEADNG